jgi:hypothetical protein
LFNKIETPCIKKNLNPFLKDFPVVADLGHDRVRPLQLATGGFM